VRHHASHNFAQACRTRASSEDKNSETMSFTCKSWTTFLNTGLGSTKSKNSSLSSEGTEEGGSATGEEEAEEDDGKEEDEGEDEEDEDD